MGRYLNSNADGFGKIVNSEIYVDKTSMLSYTNQVLNLIYHGKERVNSTPDSHKL